VAQRLEIAHRSPSIDEARAYPAERPARPGPPDLRRPRPGPVRWRHTRSFGGVTTMKVLVAYASKHGGTAEIAEAIAAQLRERGLDVDERPVAEATLGDHDAVVLGSAVFVGSWMK